MALDLYPTSPTQLSGLAWNVMKSSEESTLVQRAANAAETRIAQWQNPIWHFELIYEVLFDNPNRLNPGNSVTEYRLMQGFWLRQKGQFKSFLFDDPRDDSVGPALLADLTPNPAAQLPVVTDGAANYYSPVQRNFGGLFLEDITDLNGAITVYDDGVLKTQGTDYSVIGPGVAFPGYSFMGLVIQWLSGYVPVGPVTAQFFFYFRVRFEMDKQDFEEFVNQLWTVGGSENKNGTGYIQLMSARPDIKV